jgi:hypothetical protein
VCSTYNAIVAVCPLHYSSPRVATTRRSPESSSGIWRSCNRKWIWTPVRFSVPTGRKLPNKIVFAL